MTDREEMMIEIARILLLNCVTHTGKSERIRLSFLDQGKPGDLIMSASIIGVSEFTFGYLVETHSDHYIMRDLVSNQRCKMYNDAFFIIPESWIHSTILLYGSQRKMLKKIEKATRKLPWGLRYAGADFRDNECIVKIRKVFENENIFEVKMSYNSNTTITSIYENIKAASQNSTHPIKD